MLPFLKRVIVVSFFLSIGFVCGWWWKSKELSDDFSPLESIEYTETTHPTGTAVEPQTPLNHEGNKQVSAVDHTGHIAGPESDTSSAVKSPEREKQFDSALEHFRFLLGRHQFIEALDLYQNIEKKLLPLRATLRQEAIKFLNQSLNSQDYESFADFCELWLNNYYNDLDVLVLLAQYNASQNFYGEAISIFQLMFNFATLDGEQAKVDDAYTRFVIQRDELLVNQKNWQGLQDFYELIDQAGIANNSQLFRLAEIYFHNGYPEQARYYANQVVGSGAYAIKAEALIKDIDSGETDNKPFLGLSRQQIALERRGSHFIAQVVFPNNVRLKMLIDTGASITAISKTVQINKLGYVGYQFLPERLFNTANGVTRSEVLSVPSLYLGAFELNNTHIALLPLEFEDDIDGLLGMNILSQFRFQLDQDNAELILDKK